MSAPQVSTPIVDVRGLCIGFTGKSGRTLPILRDVDFAVAPGETVGLVGESGSGKSTLALAMMGYLKSGLSVLAGTAAFRDRDTFSLTVRELEAIRGGELALIPQNAGQSLTPTMRVGDQIAEALRLHGSVAPRQRPARVVELLSQVRLPDPPALVGRYPHELSGGQQQRVAIAMALAGEPEALLLDEPTTGLDVTTQAHILKLLRELARKTHTAMVYVSHDLGAIAQVCDRVAVMYAGEIVLEGAAREVLRRPAHPYARGLLASIPRLRDARLPVALEGRPPPPGGAGDGCAFADRCALAEDRCRERRPLLERLASGQRVRCWRHDQVERLPAGEPGAGSRARERGGPDAALELEDLAIRYSRPGLLDRLFGRAHAGAPTVDQVTLRVEAGETIGLVGESGSGKSTILKTIAGLLAPAKGAIRFADGTPLETDVDARSREQLRRIQLIFQNPDESLNPRHTVARILAQPLTLYFGLQGEALRARSEALLDRVRLGAHYLDRLPGQLSGGEKQRVAIARAFAAQPELVLCDEITSALDVSVQAAVLDLLHRLRQDEGVTYLFVSHDLAVVRALADRVAVLYQGRLCEVGPTAQVYTLPSHPYTEVLLGAVLEPDPDVPPVLSTEDVVERSPPARGCPFQRRCPRRLGDLCDTQAPPWRSPREGHAIRCHIPLEDLQSMQQTGGAEPRRAGAVP